MADAVSKPSTYYPSNHGTTDASADSIAKDIELIKSNALTKIIITPTVGSTVTGANSDNTSIECWGEADVAIGGSAQWNSAYEDALASAFSKEVSGLVNRFGGDSIPTFAVQARQQTVKSWSGSSPLEMRLDLFFIATDLSHDVRMDAVRALNMIYPIASTENANIIYAPLGHVATVASNGGQGLMAIKLGNWFESSPFFVCQNVSNVFSMKPTQSGNPLYCRMSLDFVTSELVTIKEIRQWLNQSEGTPTINLGGEDLIKRGGNQLLESITPDIINNLLTGSSGVKQSTSSTSTSAAGGAQPASLSGSALSIATQQWSNGGISI